MYLIQILLPLYDNDKNPFPQAYFTEVREQLAGIFGGVTAYANSPATGLWKGDDQELVKDKIVTYEVMCPDLDRPWWHRFRRRLEGLFKQDLIIIRAAEIEQL